MKRKEIWFLAITVFVAFFLRVRLSMDEGLHRWDERFHALVAKNVLEDPLRPTLYANPALPYDFDKWYANHVWLHKPPLPLWLIAITLKIVGIHEFAVRIPSILLSTLTVVLVFLMGRSWFSPRTGLLAAFFCGVNGLLIELASGRITSDHYDTLFVFFILFSIYLASQDRVEKKLLFTIATGFVTGLAILTKWLPALIVFPVYFFLLFHQKMPFRTAFLKISLAVLVACVVALPWQFYIRAYFPVEAAWESHYNWLHFTEELEGHVDKEGVFYYLNRLRINYSELIYFPLGYLVYRVSKEKRNYILWALLLWIFIPLIVFSLAKMKLQGYLAITAPALFIISADFFYWLLDIRKDVARKVWVRRLLTVFLVAFIFLPLRYCFERTAFGFKSPKRNEYTQGYKILEGIRKTDVVLGVADPIEFMFYNGGSAYEQATISETQLNDLRERGFYVYTYENGEVKHY